MSDETRSVLIRDNPKHTFLVSLAVGSCLIGFCVAIAGFFVAGWQQAQMQAWGEWQERERTLLVRSLEEARLAPALQRLEELAALPLLAEYLSLSEMQPETIETRELGDYIDTVLRVAIEETGLSRLVLQTGQGNNLLVAQSDLQTSETDNETRLQVSVPDHSGEGPTAGNLVAFLPGNSDTRKASGVAPTGDNPQRPDVPQVTRLFAILSGFAVSGFGLFFAFVLRRQRRSLS